MTDPRRIAGLVGPTLVVLAASEAMNAHIWTGVSATQAALLSIGVFLTFKAFSRG